MTGPFCCRCHEDFPVGDGVRIAMGQLTPLANLHDVRLRERFRDWADHPDGAYLCGNCYFDLTDED